MAFQSHQNKIYESLRDLLDIQPICDHVVTISPYSHVTKKNGTYMGVTSRLMSQFILTLYMTEPRKHYLGTKAQAIHNRTMAIGTLEPFEDNHQNEGTENATGHVTLLLTDNGVTKPMKLAWNNLETDAPHISQIMFDFLMKDPA